MLSGEKFKLRFWSKVDKRGDDECWPWLAGKTSAGYGSFCVVAKKIWSTSNRVAYELTKGPIPDGMMACHSCDNRECCNPAHLWLGTCANNLQDMRDKGRGKAPPKGKKSHASRVGVLNARSKLNEEQVLEIRRRRAGGATSISIAKLFDISYGLVGHIARRKLWAHLPNEQLNESAKC